MPVYTQISAYLWYGLTTDTKPTGVPLSTVCYETDDTKAFITRDGTNWIEATTNVLGGLPFLPDYMTGTDIGTVFSIVKTVTKSAIVAAGADLTGLSSGGALEIIGAYVQNDGTAVDSAGHAAVVELYSNNVKGSGSFLTIAQALGAANAIISHQNATSWRGAVLESGKKLLYKATTEDVTSAGTCDVYVIFRRLAAGATVAAA